MILIIAKYCLAERNLNSMDAIVGFWLVLTKTLFVYVCVELQVVQGMNYIGCFRDRWRRDFSGSHLTEIRLNTPEECVNSCLARNALYAAVQNSDECFCGNSYGKYGQLSEATCNRRCTGDREQICGGSWANSVYSTGKQLICDYTIPCSSDNGLRKDCPVNGAAKIVNATVKSHTCGTSRGNENLDDICGYHGVILWVKHRCYVQFSVCYIPLEIIKSTTKLTTQLRTSSSTSSFVTTLSKTTISSKASAITSDAASNRSSTEVTTTSNTVSVGSSVSTKQRHLPNTSTAPSYTTHSHLIKPDSTTTVVVVATIVFIGVSLVTIVAIVVYRKRHARKDRRIPLEEETFTTDQQASQYSNTLELKAVVTYKRDNSEKCITKDVYKESNHTAFGDDKDAGTDYTAHSYHILETQLQTDPPKNQLVHQSRHNKSENSKPEFQDIYYNANDIDDSLLYINNAELDAEYNTISEVPRKAIVDPDYDRLGISDQDGGFKEQDYYCHTTDTLERNNNEVVDYSHITFKNLKTKTDDIVPF